MKDTITCPFCYKESVDTENTNEEDAFYKHKCPHCKKMFAFTVRFPKIYIERKSECLNGGDHHFYEFCDSKDNKKFCNRCGEYITGGEK